MGLLSFIIILSTLCCVGCYGCSEPMGWQAKTFLDRASSADTIVYGRAVEMYPTTFGNWPEAYQTEFEFYCILRGKNPIPLSVNVTGFGVYGGLCTATEVEKGEDYILFLDATDDGGLEVIDINVQVGATRATDEVLGEVASLCNIETTSPIGGSSCPSDFVGDVEQTTDETCYRSLGLAGKWCQQNVIFKMILVCFCFIVINVMTGDH
ncbi:uncharacterized protein LOC144439088 [Glandiceps talaboti]